MSEVGKKNQLRRQRNTTTSSFQTLRLTNITKKARKPEEKMKMGQNGEEKFSSDLDWWC
jgi:hypothetical protein